MSASGLNRRDALRKMVVGGLGAATVPAWVENLQALAHASAAHVHAAAAAAPEVAWTPKVLDAHQNETVITLSELIIPTTETPGGKAALVNRFVDAVLVDAEPGDRKDFLGGLRWMDLRSNELFGADFVAATPDQQTALLTIVSSPQNKSLADQVGVEFFQAVKSLTITGYYTSEVGMRNELGDDGQLFFTEFKGCTHPEHGAPASATPRAKPAPKPVKKG
jgi:hypothetical protein